MTNRLFIFVFSFVFLSIASFSSSGLMAAQEFSSDSEHRGIADFLPYQIFPENRMDNAIYLNNQQLLALPGATLLTVSPLPQEGRFVYVSLDSLGKVDLGVFRGPDDPTPRVRRISPGLFFVVMAMDGIVYKKIYRVLQNQNLIDLLPSSKTADGITVGPIGMLFYHISAAKKTEVNGKNVDTFSLRLHLVIFEEERLRHLDYAIDNTLPNLTLAWKNETSITYTLADGRTETISIAQFQ